MKKLILGTLVSIVLLGGIIWISYPDGGPQTGNTLNNSGLAFAAEHNSYNFGTISMKNGKVTHKFQIKNTSGADIEMNRIYTSCMCTSVKATISNGVVLGPFSMPGHGGYAPYISEIFPANSEAEIEVTFDPAAHGPAGVGKIERSIIIENNSGTKYQLGISANVTP